MPEIGNSTVWSQTDASNNTGTQPSWSGSASPDTIDNAGRAMMGAITREWNWRNFTVSTTGSPNAYVVTYSVAPDALYNGQRFGFITNFANTGSATLNINSLGAKTIKKVVAGTKTALSSGDMASGAFVEVAYNQADDSFLWVNRGEIPTSFYSPGGTDIALADGGTGASLVDPNADRIMFWDDSGGAVTWLTVGSGLAITTTTMAVDIAGLAADASPDTAADYVMTLDATDSTLKKVLIDDFLPAQSGGVTFLGTITTTTGASQTLPGLTLTNYAFLRLTWNVVGANSAASFFIGNSTSDDVQSTPSISGSETISGIMDIDLNNGIGAFSYVNNAGPNVYGAYVFDSALSTASTVVSIAPSAGTLDNGSIRVYGIA
jgi:hypothetical protein